MKSNFEFSPEDADSQKPEIDMMDALLREHARLGNSEDSVLVNQILLKTVNKPSDLPQSIARESFGWQEWMKLAAIVTLSLGIIGLLLGKIQGIGSDRKVAERNESTFQLTVTYARPGSSAGVQPEAKGGIVRDTGAIVANSTADSSSFPIANVTLIEIDSPALAGNFAPSADLFNSIAGNRTESFAVTANRANRSTQILEYDGEVELKHPEFQIEAERLVVRAGGSKDSPETGAFHAFGATIKRTLESGEIEIASADHLVYEPGGQRLVLSGNDVQLTTAGAGTLHFGSNQEKLILHRNGYQVVRN